ncbi:hypothetical protein D3C73_1496730 [compost metagenome]
MRTYRVTLYRTGAAADDEPIYYMGEVEDPQRGDDVVQQAMLAHPDTSPQQCTLVMRGKGPCHWPALAQGTLQ